MPDKRVIFCSYEADVAAGWGRKVRDTLEEHSALFGVSISQKSKAANRWEIAGRRGRMAAVGMGGPITGKSADIAIIDDPIKNAEEAASPTIRERHKKWFGTTLGTRLSKDGVIILIQTRWHEDDLAGHVHAVEKSGGPAWYRIVIPAIAVDPVDMPAGAADYFGADPLGRQPGEALCPELHPIEKLLGHRKELGDTGFWALYQQYPFSPSGGVFKVDRWPYWTPQRSPLEFSDATGRFEYRSDANWKFERIISSWDFTYGSRTGRSWCVGQVWGKRGPEFWLLYQVRDKFDINGMIAAVGEMDELFPQTTARLIEGKAAGPHIIRTLRRKLTGVIAVSVQSSKTARANAVAPLVAGQTVFIPDPELFTWVRDFQAECAAFPIGATDDQVDAMSQALTYLAGNQYKAHDSKPAAFQNRRRRRK